MQEQIVKKRSKKLLEKKCQYPGCDIVFSGIHIAKFCAEHRKNSYRVRKHIEYESIYDKNQLLEHENKTTITEAEMICALEDCNNKFLIRLYPTQTVYPKYCSVHRSEYKRSLYFREKNKTNID